MRPTNTTPQIWPHRHDPDGFDDANSIPANHDELGAGEAMMALFAALVLALAAVVLMVAVLRAAFMVAPTVTVFALGVMVAAVAVNARGFFGRD